MALGHGRNDRTRFLAAEQRIADAIADRIATRLEQCDSDRGACGSSSSRSMTRWPPRWRTTSRTPSSSPGGSVPARRPRQRSTPSTSTSARTSDDSCRSAATGSKTDGVAAEIVVHPRRRETLRDVLHEIEDVHRDRDHDVGRDSDIDDAAGRQLWRNIITTHIDRGRDRDRHPAPRRLPGGVRRVVPRPLHVPGLRRAVRHPLGPLLPRATPRDRERSPGR